MKLNTDDVFLYPTDTVWGIGCSLYSLTGFVKIAEIKKTSKDKPLSIMFSDVKDIFQSFSLPEEVSEDWLELFFTLESTLGLPVKSSKIKIPSWAYGQSDYVSLRCLTNNPLMKKISSELQAPFFTTSLNLSGEPPILTLNNARDFHQKYAPTTYLLDSFNTLTETLSGSSSTIVFLKENLDFEIKREGRKSEEIKKHIMKLFSK